MVNVPEGVPWDPPPPPPPPPPPQDAIKITYRETKANAISTRLRLLANSATANIPKRTTTAADTGGKFMRGSSLIAVDRAVVFTVA